MAAFSFLVGVGLVASLRVRVYGGWRVDPGGTRKGSKGLLGGRRNDHAHAELLAWDADDPADSDA